MTQKKKNVYLFEINDVIANQIKLPYSTGIIWSHCILDKQITDNYKLDGWFYYRQDMDAIFNQIKDPAVVGFNSFVWNWRYNKKMAKRIKDAYPDCTILVGGWYPPTADRSQNFFIENPYIDIVVHGEGELTFKDVLLEKLKEKQDWKSIAGCSVPLEDMSTFVTPPRARIQDLNSMPSPYLNGLFDELIEDCPYVLESTIETTRGCPYQCTFCEIGTKYYQKIKWQENEKIFKELDWISENKVEFIYNADSNFGLLPQHLEITKYMVKKKEENGYPVGHRCDWAKNKADKVIELAKLFTDSNMDKGITIALQSMNPPTLKAVRRKNVDDGKLGEFLKMYNDWELPSYVELILGLPEETLESFIEGICTVIELDQHNYIGIYSLTALPNTPFGEKEYVDKYGLKLINTYTAFNHYDISEQNEFEREDMVVATNTMPYEDYKKAHYFRWIVMTGHYLGVVQYISRFFRVQYNISYKDFYHKYLQYAYDNPESLIGTELRNMIEALDKVLVAEQPWGRILPDVRKNFAWDFEEATAIIICKNKERFYSEIEDFLYKNFEFDASSDLLKQLIEFQKHAILDPRIEYPIEKTYDYNFDEVTINKKPLVEKKRKLRFSGDNYDGNFYDWGKEKLWWGRRIGACKLKIEEVRKQKKHTKVQTPHIGTLRDSL